MCFFYCSFLHLPQLQLINNIHYLFFLFLTYIQHNPTGDTSLKFYAHAKWEVICETKGVIDSK